MKLIKQKYNNHVSLDTVEEFEQVLLNDSKVTPINQLHTICSKALYLIFKFLSKHATSNNHTPSKNSTFKKNIFAILMGPDFGKSLPYFISPATKSLYIFDAWPKSHDEIINFTNYFKINNLFLTSSQAAEIIKSKMYNTNCYWVPEGINPEKYKYYEAKDKTIDVLALGRRYDSYHAKIVRCLDINKKVYLYEKQKGEIIFPTQSGFMEGLAKSKISICVPSSITHPDRSGNIETMTIRYLQSMVSKCIILGHAPKEMITLFGYNPVIEIDAENPEIQILSILDNYSNYQTLIEKNYQAVLESHTWSNRWNTIKKIVSKN